MEKLDETMITKYPRGKKMGILGKIFEGDDVLNSNRFVNCGFTDSPLSELPDPEEDPETLRELQMVFGNLVVEWGHYDQKYLDDILNRFLSACKRVGIDLMQTQNSIQEPKAPEPETRKLGAERAKSYIGHNVFVERKGTMESGWKVAGVDDGDRLALIKDGIGTKYLRLAKFEETQAKTAEHVRGRKMKKLAELVKEDPGLDFGLIDPLRVSCGTASQFLLKLADPEEDHHTLRRLRKALGSLVVVEGHRSQEYYDRIRDAYLDACRKAGIDLAAPRKLPGQ